MLGVVEVSVLVDFIDLSKDLFFIFFLDKRTGTTPLLAEISANGPVKVDKTDDSSADVALGKLATNVLRHSAHSAGGASADLNQIC